MKTKMLLLTLKSIYIKRFFRKSVTFCLSPGGQTICFSPRGQTFLTHMIWGVQTFLTHRREGGTNIFYIHRGIKFLHQGGWDKHFYIGGYDGCE